MFNVTLLEQHRRKLVNSRYVSEQGAITLPVVLLWQGGGITSLVGERIRDPGEAAAAATAFKTFLRS